MGLSSLFAATTWRGQAAPVSPLDLPICRGSVSRIAETPTTSQADAEADFLGKLGPLEGHLMIGRRLLDAGQARLAVPEFGHPIRKLYT